ncbi:uncharacterized protein LOC108153299 [Drosophila miranda]|uniref:uncharacterized protein LOC108153299 n=1 Tax=Drosophila miranda TaxID=7229 RepID=UPI0007E5F434|nr:uncharacterized protein LOC108153299 [Drosophila miranda]XP_017138692.1 uncharacterized protein LOC108153299 [Drosophila miranda]
MIQLPMLRLSIFPCGCCFQLFHQMVSRAHAWAPPQFPRGEGKGVLALGLSARKKNRCYCQSVARVFESKMSELQQQQNSYEQECQRAELLGLQAPDKDEFDRRLQARLEQEQADHDAAEAVLLEQQGEALRDVGGKLGELNSILSSTQQRLNRFKQTACGSLTNIFARPSSGSVDLSAAAAEAAEGAASQEERAPVQEQPRHPPTAAEVSAAKAAKQQRIDSDLDKLDALINKADNAHIAMGEQTKQMRRLAK